MQMNGLKWSVDMAVVAEVRQWQNKDTGEPQARVVLEYWGGRQELPVDPEAAAQYQRWRGQMVECGGGLTATENRFGSKVVFTIDHCQPVKPVAK